LFVPLGALTQLVGERLSADRTVKPDVALVMNSAVAPDVCTSVGKAQNPPVSK
jgi:hypothetical protein